MTREGESSIEEEMGHCGLDLGVSKGSGYLILRKEEKGRGPKQEGDKEEEWGGQV